MKGGRGIGIREMRVVLRTRERKWRGRRRSGGAKGTVEAASCVARSKATRVWLVVSLE